MRFWLLLICSGWTAVAGDLTCSGRGGKIVGVTLEGLDLQITEVPEDGRVHCLSPCQRICIPIKCADNEKIDSWDCSFLKGHIILSWVAAHPDVAKTVFAPTESERWMLDGMRSVQHLAFGAHRLYESYFGHRPSLAAVHMAIVGQHGPLSVRVAEYLSELADVLSVRLELAFYGQCYLCSHHKECARRHLRSSADRMCGWFHSLSDVAEAEVHDASLEVAALVRQREVGGVVCLMTGMCHFLFSFLPAEVVRMQLLGMSPLSDVPQMFAIDVLRDLRARVKRGDVFSTNAVTTELVAYHLGRSVPAVGALTFFSRCMFRRAWSTEWSGRASMRLLIGNLAMVVIHSHLVLKFLTAVKTMIPMDQIQHWTGYDYSNGTDVARLLGFRSCLYLPEHPHKNHFADIYSAGLPIFTPNLVFLARLWASLRQADESEDVYDGWFDRRLSRHRLEPDSKDDSTPAPFDLRTAAVEKIEYWTRLSDYFHFPGTVLFASAADLADKLATVNLDIARRQMLEHVHKRHMRTLLTLQSHFSTLIAPSL